MAAASSANVQGKGIRQHEASEEVNNTGSKLTKVINQPGGGNDGKEVERGETGGGKKAENHQENNRRFWATRTEQVRNRDRGVPLPYFPQETGVDVVDIPMEEWKLATSKFDFALVGYVFGTNPPLGKIRGYVRSRWGNEEEVKVLLLNEGIYLINCATKQKKMDILWGGPWTFDNKPFIVKAWSEEEEYKCGSIPTLPVWVRLPNIKAHLTDTTILGKICSKIGKPLFTDGVTAEGLSYNFARVCIEVSADRELSDYVLFRDPFGKVHKQMVLYEWKPPHCPNCRNFGHRVGNCPEENYEKLAAEFNKKEVKEAWKQLKEVELEIVSDTEEDQNGIQKSSSSAASDSGSIKGGNNSTKEHNVEDTSIESFQEVNSENNSSEDCTIAEKYKEVLSKSAAKRARKKARLEKEKEKKEAEDKERAEILKVGNKYKKAARELREEEEKEYERRKKGKLSKNGGKNTKRGF